MVRSPQEAQPATISADFFPKRLPVPVNGLEVAPTVTGTPGRVDLGVQVDPPAPATAQSGSGSCQGSPAGTRPSTASPSGPASARTCGKDPRVNPRLFGAHKMRVHGEPLAQVKPASPVSRARSSMCGQGRSGLTWSGVSGLTPPQSSMPARTNRDSSSASVRFGGAWSRASGRDEARHGDGGRHTPRRQIVGAHHRRGSLGPEVLDDDFLDMAVTAGGGRIAKIASTRSA